LIYLASKGVDLVSARPLAWQVAGDPTGAIVLPNAAHWRCRWWLLRGHFPYVRGTPTDFTHLRFFTLNEIRHWLSDRDIAIQHVDGSASLWVRGLYPAWFRRPPFATLYVRLAHRFPTFFARDLIVIGRKGLGVPRSNA